MHWTASALLLLSAALLGGGVEASSSPASSIVWTNTQRFLFDVDGNQIDAYGSKINLFQGSYYLYGNSFSTTGSAFGIKSYSSPDLKHWKYEGFLYDPTTPNPCDAIGGCGRPHIVFNSESKTYVLWANAGSSGYIVGTSTSPSGPFTFMNETAAIDPQFDGLQPADFAVETFNGKGYIVFSVLNFRSPNAGSIWPPIFQTLHISELTPDYTNTTLTSYRVTSPAMDLIDQETESPDFFVTENGTFYVFASNTCGYCNGSIALMYRANSLNATWDRQILSGYSCNGQLEGILPLQSPQNKAIDYIWHSTSVPGGPRTGFSGHIFQPLQFASDGSVHDLNCASSAAFNVSFVSGSDSLPSGVASSAVDGSPMFADVSISGLKMKKKADPQQYEAVCDSDQFTLYQTWQASQSGSIKSVSVNVASSVQTVPLTMTLFKFDSYQHLTAPE